MSAWMQSVTAGSMRCGVTGVTAGVPHVAAKPRARRAAFLEGIESVCKGGYGCSAGVSTSIYQQQLPLGAHVPIGEGDHGGQMIGQSEVDAGRDGNLKSSCAFRHACLHSLCLQVCCMRG